MLVGREPAAKLAREAVVEEVMSRSDTERVTADLCCWMMMRGDGVSGAVLEVL